MLVLWAALFIAAMAQTAKLDLSIIGNSPLISTLNTFLNTPLLGGMMSNGNNKIIKVQGYKGQLTKDDNGNGQINYTMQIPLGNSLGNIHC